jgi:hypothetical protein
MEDPVAFWEKAASGIHWERPFSRVLSNEPGKYYSWYDGGLTNASYNALVREAGQRAAPCLGREDRSASGFGLAAAA